MNRLPRELIDNICAFLPKHDLKNLLTVSVPFRYAAEMHSGAFEKFTIDENNSERFLTLYSGHRLPYLQEVIFRPSIAEPVPRKNTNGWWECREDEQGLLATDESFTKQVRSLFDTLKTLETSVKGDPAQCCYRLTVYSPTRKIDSNRLCFHHGYLSWRIHLLHPWDLPTVSSIISLELRNTNCRDEFWLGDELKVDPRVALDLATKLPNLEALNLQTGAYEWCATRGDEEPTRHYECDWSGPRKYIPYLVLLIYVICYPEKGMFRSPQAQLPLYWHERNLMFWKLLLISAWYSRDARHGFANAVKGYTEDLPSSLWRASLDFLCPLDRSIDFDHAKGQPNLVNPAKWDPFSSSLRILICNLRQLRLRAAIDESLFWPEDGSQTFGPNLEILEITFQIAHPSGKWYFQGPDERGRDAVGFEITSSCYPPYQTSELDLDMDSLQDEVGFPCYTRGGAQFRIVPHDANLRPLLEGYAKAAQGMHRLKEAALWTVLRWKPESDSDSGSEMNDVDDDYGGGAWGITYSAPELAEPKQSCRLLTWTVDRWRPDPELHDAFQRIGRTKHGETLEENWIDGLGSERSFRYYMNRRCPLGDFPSDDR
ncbi:hypothetical protein FB567DRAFT_109620 [Paraphoma chrysanthemicola]|uniref:F-box domain-containing protein n=1 Tax=Paraphoma chrysanthemicola TaxID=798071 RepID=A0A8K0QZJ5_9PLEO|nr:hypothetical protein FB567DRAFT_109620 [Paraphoma chrysanthemicola]